MSVHMFALVDEDGSILSVADGLIRPSVLFGVRAALGLVVLPYG